MKDKVKVGVIGLGKIAQIKYLPALRGKEECILTAICDQSVELLHRVGDIYGISQESRYLLVKEIMNTDLDIVFVLTHEHEELIVAALEKGKHVFVEKPVCWEAKRARQLMEKAQKQQILLIPGYMKLYDPAYLFMKEKLKEKGNPVCIRANCYAGNVKRWADPLYSIQKEKYDEKQQIKKKLKEGWEACFARQGWETKEMRKLAQTILQLGIHHINLFQNLFEMPAKVKSCYSGNSGVQYFQAQFMMGNVPCDYVLIPLFQAPWKWEETYEVVYTDCIIRLSFQNPFLPYNESKVIIQEQNKEYVKQEYLFDQQDSFKIQLDNCIEKVLSGEWENEMMQHAVCDLELIEAMMEKVEFL